jgi:hypothetical protein
MPQVCLTWYVPLSGFAYPLNGLLLPKPLDHYFRSKRLWVLPLQSFSPDERSLPLSGEACSHAVNPPGFPRDPLVDPTSELSSLSSSPLTADGFTHTTGALLSWGYAFLRFSPS